MDPVPLIRTTRWGGASLPRTKLCEDSVRFRCYLGNLQGIHEFRTVENWGRQYTGTRSLGYA